MLDGAGDGVPALFAMGEGDAAQREVVCLGGAGGKDDLVGVAAKLAGDGVACGGDERRCALPEQVARRGVGVVVAVKVGQALTNLSGCGLCSAT